MHRQISGVMVVTKNDDAYYHVYTKGLESDTIFREDADYITGMNYVAILHFKLCVSVLAFVLMSNHFHFILRGSKSDVDDFITLYKDMVSRYVRNKYGDKKILRRVKTGISPVNDLGERLKELIAYVLNNPVKAGVNILPQSYLWGSGGCYFSNMDTVSGCVPIDAMKRRQQIDLLKSNVKLPGTYKVNSYGFIDPKCYVDYKFVESLFGRARSMEYFLSVSNRKYAEETQVGFSDALLIAALKELLAKKYDSISVPELEYDSQLVVVRQLRRQFYCTPKQIARICGLSLSRVYALLE